MNKILKHLKDPLVKHNLEMRNKIKQVARELLIKNNFTEYDTPVLMPVQGEKYNSYFYVSNCKEEMMLADSPQIFKQMLLFAGIERYFQFAHCFRPIDGEKDMHTRLYEFMQIDIEMSEVSLLKLIDFAEMFIKDIINELKISYPIHISRMNGIYCRELYGEELKPDLRTNEEEISIVIIDNLPLTNGEKTSDSTLIPCHHIFALPTENIINNDIEYLKYITTESFDIVINGIEVGGGDLRINERNLQEKLMNIFAVNKEKYNDYLEMLSNYNGKQNGGFAIGLERLIMALTNCASVDKTVCFPFVN